MPATCQFKFTRMTPIYYGGDLLTGSVYLSSSKPLLLEAIELTLTGHETVQWFEYSKYSMLEHNDSSSTQTRIAFEGRQVLLNDRRSLTGGIMLQPSDVRIEKFCFQLPERLPPTFVHNNGEVDYSLNVILHRGAVRNKVFKQRIVVRKRLDLNQLPQYCVPRSISSNDVKFSVLSTGFVPGQDIAYHVEHLTTAPECNKVLLNLCRYFTFRALKPRPKTKTIESLVASNAEKVVCSTVTGILQIPLTTPISSTEDLALIEVSYSLEAVLYAKRRILQKLVIPIMIGTVRSAQATDLRGHVLKGDGPYCYDNLASATASSAIRCARLNGNAATLMLAGSGHQQLEHYTSPMMPQCANARHEDIEMSLFKCIEDGDRKHLLAMPKLAY